MQALLFEEPFQLGFMVVVALLVLAGIWNRSRSTSSQRALLGGVLLGAGLMAMQHFVVTDRERLMDITKQMSRWVEAGDIVKIVSLLDPHIEFAQERDINDFEKQVVSLLERYDVQEPGVGGFEFTWRAREATIECAAHCNVETPRGRYPVRSRWHLAFRLIQDEWKIVDLRPISIMDRKVQTMWDIQ